MPILPKISRKRRSATHRPDTLDTQNIQIQGGDDNVYARSVDEGHRVDPRLQKIFILVIVLLVLYFVALVVPKNLFNENLHRSGYAAGYTFSWFIDDLLANVNSLVATFTGNDTSPVAFSSTMIRYIIIAITGAGMATCGAVYQGSFRNALVSPSTLGVMSGAGLGMVIWIVFFVEDDGSNAPWLAGFAETTASGGYLLSSYSLAIVSFLGCLLVVGVVLAVMKLSGRGLSSPIMLIIAGQVMGSVIGAITGAVTYYYMYTDPYSIKAQLIRDLQIASFYRNYTWIDLVAVGIPLLITFVIIMALRRRLQLLAFSPEEARAMGVDSKRLQAVVVGLCTLLTAIVISFCGQVGFVGFLVPHMARRLVGPNFQYLLPASTVLGAVFVLGAYLIVIMTLGSSYETMVGVYISIAGAVIFLATALSGKGGVRGEFK